jgi:hypothetical protein
VKNATATTITAADLRARIAEKNIHKYVVAARSHVNPVKLSALLHERCPLDQRIAERIMRVLEESE